jgi:hypothetical protein
MPADPVSVVKPGQAAPDTPASRFPLDEFRRAMEARDVDAALELLTDDAVARPLGSDLVRFQGKREIRALWNVVLDVGEFRYGQEVRGEDTIMVLFDIKFADQQFEAIDVLRIDENGKCREIFAMARPYMPISLFTGRVAIAFARQGGGILRRIITAILVLPLEISQRIGEPVGAWLVQGAMDRGLRRSRR